MCTFYPLVVRLSILLVIPLSDLAVSLSAATPCHSLALSNGLSLLQYWLYAHHYYTTDKKLSLFSCCSFFIYAVSLLSQLRFRRRSADRSSLGGSSALFSSSAQDIPSRPHSGSSLINNFTNSLSNSISISPALTSLSKRSTDLLLFKIDDILSPHMQSSQQQIPARSDLHPITTKEKGPAYNSYSPSLIEYLPTGRPSLRSSKTSPIMATLLALSAVPPSNAAPVVTLNSASAHNYNISPVLNFLLATSINLVSMHACSHCSTLHLFKSLVTGITWLLILLMGCPFTPALPSTVVILFENDFLILINTIIPAVSFILCALRFFSNRYTPEKGNDINIDNSHGTPSKQKNIVVSYRTIPDI
ncbi:hypothetical protein PICMEDRAFT_99107 [Pichia membranifaciens NRRL Y-2026]|uniref:Uncharacterized protein n=1 Tax=Pichia membranifaciens NRRL Y-2026 TaxID=763406 RepID=A0A1E3NUH8_9ASCO|nr:hypothetical protein PICMEDRAFT_99107 [Pichia membranifaciens NRRL Y-2026]ODQ49298.1 hypothetical protein PICMEDRAFT_99107 [Pichia membranifaciens NRRL Y-2026]